MTPIKVHSRTKLVQAIREAIDQHGLQCNLNHIDVSNVTDMSHLFEGIKFNGDISEWDTSNVKEMQFMFCRSDFNGDVSKWKVSNVTDMRGMFAESPFNGDVSAWSINPYARMGWMFKNAAFTGDISSWTNCGTYRLSMFSSFHDSPQGYFGVLINNYDFPQDHPQAATFHQLRALTESLDLSPEKASVFIYQEMHYPHQIIDIPAGLDLSHDKK